MPIGTYLLALAVARKIGDRRNEGTWLGNLGQVEAGGDHPGAIEHYQQALAIFEEIKDPNAERVRGWLAELK